MSDLLSIKRAVTKQILIVFRRVFLGLCFLMVIFGVHRCSILIKVLFY